MRVAKWIVILGLLARVVSTSPAAAAPGDIWKAVGGVPTQMNSSVTDIVFHNGVLIAAGYFTDAGGDPNADYVAKFENGQWSALGSGTGPNSIVLSLASHGGVLYAGGFFGSAGGDVEASGIAKFEGVIWSSLGGAGTGLNGQVTDIKFEGGVLHAAGNFFDAGGDPDADRIARYQSGSWVAIGPNASLNDMVSDIEFEGGVLHAAGYFTDAGGDTDADYVAMYTGSAWSTLGGPGTGMNSRTYELQFHNGVLYAGGNFTDAGGDSDADYIAKYESGAWSSLDGPGTGLNEAIFEILVDNNTLILMGQFTDAGGDPDADRIAKFESGILSSLEGPNSGLGSLVYTAELHNGALYAGGGFTNAGGDLNADYIAQFGNEDSNSNTGSSIGSSSAGNFCALDTSGGICQIGSVWVNVPSGALPSGLNDCRLVIEDAGTAASYGLQLDESVYDVRVECGGMQRVTQFSMALTVCIRPQSGPTANKLLFHRHGSASTFGSLTPAARSGYVCGLTQQLSLFVIGGLALPATGFAPDVHTALAPQPAEHAYTSTELTLQIPRLNLQTSIVGVPENADGWDVSWLGQQVGYLYGTAFPTWAGNTVLTAHVWDANNQPGPFARLAELRYGDHVEIVAWGQTYVYEVRSSETLRPSAASDAMASSTYDVLTLITCENFDPLSGEYRYRRVVTAVLVGIK